MFFKYLIKIFFRINDPLQKENLGIIVQYRVKIKLIVSMGGYVNIKKFFIYVFNELFSTNINN